MKVTVLGLRSRPLGGGHTPAPLAPDPPGRRVVLALYIDRRRRIHDSGMLAQPLLQHQQVPELRGNPLAFDTFRHRIPDSAPSDPSFVLEKTLLRKLS